MLPINVVQSKQSYVGKVSKLSGVYLRLAHKHVMVVMSCVLEKVVTKNLLLNIDSDKPC